MLFSKYLISGLSIFGLLGLWDSPGLAQVTAAADGTGTIVTNSPTPNQFDITNGTRSGGNLFHSFQQFSVGAGQTANFTVSPDVQNVLARVSGGAASIVDGTIKLEGVGVISNFYLMNPAGIVFGNNAQLNVPAAFVGTTANGIGFGNGQWFSASGANDFSKLSGAPTQFAFTESNPGAIINAGKLSTKDDKPLALIGGTIVATQYWENNGALALVTVEGAQVVELRLPGQLLRLGVKVTPMKADDAIPNRWTTPIATLPTLLTGGDVKDATKITTDVNGRIILSATNPQPITVNSGDIVVDSIKILNQNKRGDIYDIWIDAQKTFRALGNVPNSNPTASNPDLTPINPINTDIALPVSIRSIGKTTINQGGQSFTEAIGYQKDTNGIVIRDSGGQRVFLKGTSIDASGNEVTKLEYAEGIDFDPLLDRDVDGVIDAKITTPADPTFNATQTNPLASYTKGLVVSQDSVGNGTLLGSLQDSSLSGTPNIQIGTSLRLKGVVGSSDTGRGGNGGGGNSGTGDNRVPPPSERPPETSCVSRQQSGASSRSNSSSATCTSGQTTFPGESDQILQILPSP